MTEPADDPIPVGSPATAEEAAFLDWAQRSLEDNLKLVNDVLRQQVALVAALLAASVALFRADLIEKGAAIALSITLLVSLAVAFVGVMPYEASVDLSSPRDFKRHKREAYRFKRNALWLSGLLLALALGAAIAAVWAA